VGQGAPLPTGARHFFESRFGRDFTDVRVYDDATAHARAGALGAAAFTQGTDIYFAAGRYKPSTASGRWVLAHELAHVAQQGGRNTKSEALSTNFDGRADDEHAAERQAHVAATSIMAGRAPDIAADGRGVRMHMLTEAAFRAALGTTRQQ